jgi:adenosine kinase
MRICEHTDTHNKIFCTNLSAPFICEFFGDRLMKAMPYVDYLFGNETVSLTRFCDNTKIFDVLGSKKFW